MAVLNEKQGSIIAHCRGCKGGRSTFEWKINGKEIGAITDFTDDNPWRTQSNITYRLYKCAGCGMGAYAIVLYKAYEEYPGSYNKLVKFYPESKERLQIPKDTPKGIQSEFREAEKCHENDCYRASAGLLRSVLDKTMKANGYDTRENNNLYKQIEAATEDGVITQARKKRAHDEIRVLGNDVLHDEWYEIPEEDVIASKHYCQRILEDFYDDRDSVLSLLREASRVPDEDKTSDTESTS